MSATTELPGATAFVCATCGVQHAPHPDGEPPPACAICDDERQYVPEAGQRWTTLAALRATHRNVFAPLEPGLVSIRSDPAFAIHQHAMLVQTPEGNVLWDCITLVDQPSVVRLRELGGVAAIAISHPHFYATMVEWSRLLGGVPIYLHAADAAWIARPDPAVRLWSGASPALPGGLSLVRTGGHFAGSQVLHWPAGAGGRGAILAGDDPNVCADRRWVNFMHSYPNYLPLGAAAATAVAAALRPLAFDRIYGWTPDRVVRAGAHAIVERSLERHLRALEGRHDAVRYASG